MVAAARAGTATVAAGCFAPYTAVGATDGPLPTAVATILPGRIEAGAEASAVSPAAATVTWTGVLAAEYTFTVFAAGGGGGGDGGCCGLEGVGADTVRSVGSCISSRQPVELGATSSVPARAAGACEARACVGEWAQNN
jgi:hypothetical protein